MLILLLILLVIFPFTGVYYNGGMYKDSGFGLGFILLVILLVLFLTHSPYLGLRY